MTTTDKYNGNDYDRRKHWRRQTKTMVMKMTDENIGDDRRKQWRWHTKTMVMTMTYENIGDNRQKQC